MPQLALINISVFDDQNKMIAHRVLPVVGLRPGYRYISLKNESNRALNMCLLFVHIKLQDYVPAEFERKIKNQFNISLSFNYYIIY